MATAISIASARFQPLDRRYVRRLTDSQIAEIRAVFAANPRAERLPLAKKYRISLATVSNIRNNRASYAPHKQQVRQCVSLPPLPRCLPHRIHAELFQVFALRGPRNNQTWDSFITHVMDLYLIDNHPDRIPKLDVAEVFKTPPPATRNDVQVHRGKLTAQEIEKIREQYGNGDMPRDIAGKWGKAESTIRRVIGPQRVCSRAIKRQRALFYIDDNWSSEDVAKKVGLTVAEVDELREGRQKVVPTSLRGHPSRLDAYGMPKRGNHAAN